MNKFPPKPPRFPPWLFNSSAISNYILALLVVVLDGSLIYVLLRDGTTNFQLSCMTLAFTFAIYGCYRTIRRVHESLTEWNELRRHWQELHDAINRDKGQ